LSLSAGTRLGVYEIISAIGEGGMGAVFRARDTRLDRDVAIKVLPEAFAHDADRLARFTREAKTLAALNHPHIAAIYGLEEARSGGSLDPPITGLVMELVEGDDLSQRIKKGAIPIDEALPIAKQIAEALEAAHEQGIIHRDLKPANIKVRPDGTVKVLDFGLAKALDPTAASSTEAMNSPTITSPAMTQAGMILGTAAYMAPEQARGKVVGKRADIWAFGAVLFEMLTGTRAFGGDDVAETLANVINKEPAWEALPLTVPSHMQQALRLCLKKSSRERVPDIGAVRLALEGAFEAAATQAATPILTAPQPVWRRVLPVAAAVAISVLLTAAAAWRLWPATTPAAPAPVNRFSYRVPDGRVLRGNLRQVIAISPDGRRFVYNATGGLYVRGLDELEAHLIPGAEAVFSSPVFSPDGQSVAYWQEGQLRRVAISGGAPVVIGPVPENPTGVYWDPDGTIWFGQLSGIHKVPAAGGTPAVVVAAERGEQLGVSRLLPDGDTVLFTLLSQAGSSVVAQKISTGERKVLVEDGFAPRYLATGHLVYLVDNVLMGVAFDARRMAVTGDAVPVARNVAHVPSRRSLRPFYGYDVATDGTLVHVYSPGADNISRVGLSDRTGTVTPLTLSAGTYDTVRVSPDGTRIAVGVADPKQAYVAIWDLDGRTALRRLTFGGNHRYPIWSRDGQRVTYQSDREGDVALYWQRADGTGPAERLTRPEKGREHIPASWSPNDDTLLFTDVSSSTTTFAGALWTYERQRGTTAPFAGVSGVAQSPMFSPDGRWVAYATRDQGGGPFGIYVQPVPATGTRYQLPNLTGSAQSILPVWSPDGTALYSSPRTGQLAVTAVTTRPTFGFGISIEVPRWFTETVDGGTASVRSFDLMPDGRFIGLRAPGPSAGASGTAPTQPEIHIVLNWLVELKRLVPVK